MNVNIAHLNNIFENKRVILVGPANNLIGTNLGKFIDSHDVVCRLNNSFIIGEERQKDYGRKCDVLINSCNTRAFCIINRYIDYLKDCKLIINPSSKVHNTDYKNNGKNVYQNYLDLKLNIPFYQVEGEYEKNMVKKGINTGLCALEFLLNGINLKNLYICGFSFYGVKDKNYVKKDKVKSYETYLFDKKIFNCDCDKSKPCRQRRDPLLENKTDKLKELDYFKENIMNHPKAILDNSIKNLLIE